MLDAMNAASNMKATRRKYSNYVYALLYDHFLKGSCFLVIKFRYSLGFCLMKYKQIYAPGFY